VYENYFGARKDDKHVVFSITKSILGLLVYIAHRKGMISYDTKVNEIIPELTNGIYSNISINDLLSMKSGIDWIEDYEKSSILSELYYKGISFEYLNSVKLKSGGSKEFNYSSL